MDTSLPAGASIGKVGPVRRIPAEPDHDDKPTLQVYASSSGVELVAAPVVLTPGETVVLINLLVKALHAAAVLGSSGSRDSHVVIELSGQEPKT